MPNRREFVTQAITAAGVGALGSTAGGAAASNARKGRPLRILFLGGTGTLGPYFVKEAAGRGHRVAVFNRGRSRADLPRSVEHLVGDRNGDFKSIRNRDWDAVCDLATYVPKWVRSIGEALQGRVGHYTFISTINVYDHADGAPETREDSKLLLYRGTEDPFSLTGPGKYYGELKVVCEQEAEKQFPGKALLIRPTYIIGPRDSVGALTYWAARMAQGGEVLAAGDPLSRLHVIDVRDMAKWSIDMIERSATGAYNAVGPAEPINWGGLLKELRTTSATPVTLTWVPVSWLAEHQIVNPYSNLLFWHAGVSTSHARLIINDKARAAGLTFRPILASAADALAFCQEQPADQQIKLLSLDGMKSLDESFAREKSLLGAWHRDAGTA